MRSIVSGADSGGTVTVCGTNEGGFRAAVSACRMRPVGEILAGQDGCLRRGPVAVRSGSGRSDCGIYGTSEDGLPSFGRLSEGLRYPAAANRWKLIIFIAVSVSVGMYPTVRPFNGERL